MSDTFTLGRPDDAHLHLRDGEALRVTVPSTARAFARAVVMPNLVPPVTTVTEAREYRRRILHEVPDGTRFEPLMTLYLSERSTPDEIRRAAEASEVVACKLYPRGATTNSEDGIRDLDALEPVLAAMQEADLPLLVHGEETAPDVDVFDRERVFLERSLAPLCERFEKLRVVLEHVTTADGVRFVEEARDGVAATLTPQHLLMNRNDLLVGGLRPHHYCLPVLKRREHQEALQRAATSGDSRFFLGTDSAPHARSAKEGDCGCAGCFTAPAALPLYAELFERLGALERLDAFASRFAAEFYGLPRNEGTVTLRRAPWVVPDRLPFVDGGEIVPYWAGRRLAWQLV